MSLIDQLQIEERYEEVEEIKDLLSDNNLESTTDSGNREILTEKSQKQIDALKRIMENKKIGLRDDKSIKKADIILSGIKNGITIIQI